MFNEKVIGAIAGFAVGIAFIAYGALDAFFLALFILAGWLIGKFLLGEIDVLDAYERFMESKGKRSRR
ncbi:MAG: DUF2273 domain-containing protein [Dehalococcoidia bacterium]|jgi:hypothetical protein|nr:DUF2273 domain-containing protein [Dehalococcoidia bacterium]